LALKTKDCVTGQYRFGAENKRLRDRPVSLWR